MARQEIVSFLHLVEIYIYIKFCHRNIHNIEAWGQGETLFWCGDELRHSFSDKTHSQEFHDYL